MPAFGLLNANARLYDPSIGRFLSPDPLLALRGYPLDFNPYIYANNNPFSYVDPDGEFAWLLLAAAVFTGGVTNVMYNRDYIHNFGQGLAFFAVGAASTAAGIGMSFIPIGVGGAIGGAILGTAGGSVSGFLLGGGNALITGQNFWKSAWGATWKGAIIGGVSGAAYGGLKALNQNKRFWTGNDRHLQSTVLSPHEIGEIGERQAAADFEAEGGEVLGRHAAYRVEGVDGYGFTDIVGRKGDNLYIIEAKNGNSPHFTKFQKKAFLKMNNGAGIEFFGPNAKKFDLPTGPLTNYDFQIRRYHQYIYPLP